MRQHLTKKNKIKLDLNAPNIGEHIWAVMNILFYCEKYNKENQYLCSIETEGVPYIRPEFPKVAKCNESKKCGKIEYKVPESKGKKLEIYFSVMTSDGILDEIKELNAIKVARENEVSRLREIFEENQKNEGDLFQKDILAFENWEKGFSLSDFRVEIFSDDKFTLVISGKQSPNIMKSILTACGMKVDGRTKKISANQMTLITLCQVMDKAEIMCDPSAVYNLMLFEVRRRHKGIPQFAKHRIVSFAATDCILPQDVVSLAERIASIYARNGFITAYGIHADRFNVHIHFAVCAVSFQTQNMFHIQWEAERKMLVSVTNQWKSEFDEMLQNNIQMRQSREAALYGDDIVRYGSVPITAKGQMVQNRRAKIGK